MAFLPSSTRALGSQANFGPKSVQLLTVLHKTSQMLPKSSLTHCEPLAQSLSLLHGLVQ